MVSQTLSLRSLHFNLLHKITENERGRSSESICRALLPNLWCKCWRIIILVCKSNSFASPILNHNRLCYHSYYNNMSRNEFRWITHLSFSIIRQTPGSTLTFEGTQVIGVDSIMAKLRSVGQVKHDPKSMDVQPSSSSNAILIFVTGSIRIGGDNPLHYCEMFQLVSTGPGAYYVHNNVFRLNYGLWFSSVLFSHVKFPKLFFTYSLK